MFDPQSRYYNLPTVQLTTLDADGTARLIAYKPRRFLPAPEQMVTLVEHTVSQGERLDHVTARYLGDPLQFWRVCDANRVLAPTDLTDEIGTVIRIAMPAV